MDNDPAEVCNASEGLPDSITKIAQVMNEEDLKLMKNEALVKYTKLEIEKLQAATKELNDNYRKLQAENVLLQKQSLELDISIEEGRKSLEIKTDILVKLRREKDEMESELTEQASRCEAVYNEYVEKYKDARKGFETYHPLYKQVKQLQTDNLKIDVQYKISQAKIVETKKQIKLRREIDKKIFYAKIVKFAKNVLDYWKTRELAQQLAKAQEEQARLLKEQQEMELLVANMNMEQGRKVEVRKEPPKLMNPDFKVFNIEDVLKDSNRDTSAMPPPAFAFRYPFGLTESSDSLEERKLQLRTKWKQRQQQWEQQRSFSVAVPNRKSSFVTKNAGTPVMRSVKQPSLPGRTPVSSQKRPLISTRAFNSPLKYPKPDSALNNPNNENISVVNQQSQEKPIYIQCDPKNPAFIGQTGKAKILSVHKLVSNPNPVSSSQHLHQPPAVLQLSSTLRGAKQNQEIPRQVPQHFLKASQNYQPESNISQIQFQESDRNMSIPSSGINVNVPNQQGISKTASQHMPHYLSQTPLRSSQNAPLYSSPVVSQTVTQGNSQTIVDSAKPLPSTTASSQYNISSNLPPTTFSNGSQPTPTQTTYKSVDNSTGTGTSQSSTYSQKMMAQQFQQILQKQPPDVTFNLPSLPQIKTSRPGEMITASPFFSKAKGAETTECNENTCAQEPVKDAFNNPTPISQYLDNAAVLTYQEEESNMSFNEDYPNLFTPEYDQNLNESAENPTQMSAFNFNFGHAEASQPNEMKFVFPTNPSASSNPFNMF